MAQVLQRAPSKSDQFAQAILGGVQGFQQGRQQAKQAEALKQAGVPANLSPELQKVYLAEKLKGETAQKKNFSDQLSNKKAVESVRQYFGDEVGDLYDAATEGGKTQILQHALEARQRGIPFNPEDVPKEIDQEEMIEKPTEKFIDFDKGLTPKERARRQENRYAKNLPLFEESQKKLHALSEEEEHLNTLKELSPQIGTLQRLNINPQTGDLMVPLLASPEAQRFVKTINDFTTMAKQSYGARVTNFDLTQFMKRLPTLANSEEGRRQILEQMTLINSINKAYESALHDTIDNYGGIRNIDFDQAQTLADKKSKKQITHLKSQFKDISNRQNKTYEKYIDERKKTVPKGMILIESDGEIGMIAEGDLEEALKDGAKKL